MRLPSLLSLAHLLLQGLSELACNERPRSADQRLPRSRDARSRTSWPQNLSFPSGCFRLSVRVGGLRSELGHAGDYHERPYRLLVPSSYTAGVLVQLWLLAPGVNLRAESLPLGVSAFADLAERRVLALAVLEDWETSFDAVAYVRSVLYDASRRINVDSGRVRCVGFTRGASLCSRLASELSSFVSAVAMVEEVHYPRPNNSSRAMPIVALQGVVETTSGGPQRWGADLPEAVEHRTNLPEAIQLWSSFNFCTHAREEETSNLTVIKNTGCTENVSVVLYNLRLVHSHVPIAAVLNVGDSIATFFEDYRIESSLCHTSRAGEPCYDDVEWAKKDVELHPDTYDGLSGSSSFEAFQGFLRQEVYADCPPPCPTATTGTATAIVAASAGTLSASTETRTATTTTPDRTPSTNNRTTGTTTSTCTSTALLTTTTALPWVDTLGVLPTYIALLTGVASFCAWCALKFMVKLDSRGSYTPLPPVAT